MQMMCRFTCFWILRFQVTQFVPSLDSSCVEELRLGLANNMLKLNDFKTEFFIAASPQYMNRLSNTTIQIRSATIIPSPTIKNLGITFDTAMTMSDHITSLCKSINFLLWNLARFAGFGPWHLFNKCGLLYFESWTTLMHSLIIIIIIRLVMRTYPPCRVFKAQ